MYIDIRAELRGLGLALTSWRGCGLLLLAKPGVSFLYRDKRLTEATTLRWKPVEEGDLRRELRGELALGADIVYYYEPNVE